jgi:hypothetical protein
MIKKKTNSNSFKNIDELRSIGQPIVGITDAPYQFLLPTTKKTFADGFWFVGLSILSFIFFLGVLALPVMGWIILISAICTIQEEFKYAWFYSILMTIYVGAMTYVFFFA